MTINIQPIAPLNNVGASGFPPNHLSSAPARPSGGRLKSAFDSIEVDRIKKHGVFYEGSYEKQFATKRYAGFKGQLAKVKHEGRRSVTKNLSAENLEQIHDLLAKRIKKKAPYAPHLFNRRDRMAVLKESRELVKTSGSKFTKEDRKDSLKIMQVMQRKYKDSILHRDENFDVLPTAEPLASSGRKYSVSASQLKDAASNNFASGHKLTSRPDLNEVPSALDKVIKKPIF